MVKSYREGFLFFFNQQVGTQIAANGILTTFTPMYVVPSGETKTPSVASSGSSSWAWIMTMYPASDVVGRYSFAGSQKRRKETLN